MPPLVRFLVRRLVAIPVTLFFVSLALYAIALQTPPEIRAQLYLSQRERAHGDLEFLTRRAAEKYGLYDPFWVQYTRWLDHLVRGEWGYSPTMRADVLPGLIRRTPVTIELTLWALVLFVPLALLAGVMAGGRRNQPPDSGFRLLAFGATAIPPFVLGLVLLAIFYTGLRWFPPDRMSTATAALVRSEAYRAYTGLLTVDGLLNGRPEVTLDALRHLVLPVVTLSLSQWATLGRITRLVVIDELQKNYVLAARARGLRPRRILWRHVFRNAAGPSLVTSALAAASLLTGVFIIEIVFNLHGVSEVATAWMRDPFAGQRLPDTAAMMGFAVYSVIVVQLLMLALDLVQAVIDPRFRERLGEA
jgi:peptide/nickel transport system permease protein